MNDFVVTDFCNVSFVEDYKGKKTHFKNRQYSSFIITVKGKIQFTHNKNSVVSDARHAVFLPKGLTYTNRCLESAESYVFNFHTKKQYETPCALSSISKATAEAIYDKLTRLSLGDSRASEMLIFKEVYELAAQLFESDEKASSSERLLSQAIQFMHANFSDPSLRVESIAKHCFISEIYLRKLFSQKYNTTPFRYLTKIRMETARFLLLEKIPVTRIALKVGYSDVYQFSRAFKKYYGVSPSDM